MQHTLAIIHMDEEYAYSLMDFMNHHKEFGFKAFAFSKKELYFEFQKQQKVQVLLFDDSLSSEDLKKVNTVSTYYLREVLSTSSLFHCKSIFMYQSAYVIMKQITEYYTMEGNIVYSGNQLDSCNVIGVCSVMYHKEQFDLALSLAKEFSEKANTLLVSFQPFITSNMISQERGYDLSEAIYLVKQEEINLIKLKDLISASINFNFLGGVEHYSDVADLTTDEVARLMDSLIRLNLYQYIVVDVPMPGGATSSILSQCELIYESFKSGDFSKQMKNEFYRQLVLKEGDQILERIKVIPCA